VRYAAICVAAALLAVAGCIPSQPLDEGEIGQYWLLTDVPDPNAGAPAPAPGPREGFRVPRRWTIRQHASTIWATVSIVRAMDKIKAGTDEIAFSVSPSHARALADALAQAREALVDLKEMVDAAGGGDRNRWAGTLADALVKAEAVARMVVMESEAPPPEGAEPIGMAGEPVLQMISAYLNERAGGGLLEDLAPGQVRRLRDVLVQVIVKLGFEIAGKEPDADVREDVLRQMRETGDLAALRKALRELLTERIDAAAVARKPSSKRKTVQTVLSWAPRSLKLLEAFLAQWDKMDSITVELLRREEGSAVAVTIAVKEGREVRLADVMVLMPTIVFRGTTRISVLPDAAGADETVVTLNPVGSGAVELRYEGLLYGLVKLLALPLADGPVREVRVSSGQAAYGEKLLHVAVLTEATGDKADPRRMIVVQDRALTRTAREAFSLRTVTEKRETVVSYLTPGRRYTYQRIKAEADR